MTNEMLQSSALKPLTVKEIDFFSEDAVMSRFEDGTEWVEARMWVTIARLRDFLANDGYKVDHDFVEDTERHASDPYCATCGETIYDHPLADRSGFDD